MITYDPKESEYLLSSGRRVYANHGLLSIRQAGEYFEIYQGYDGFRFHWPEFELDDEESMPPSDADVIEIADLMIERWTCLKEAVLRSQSKIQR